MRRFQSTREGESLALSRMLILVVEGPQVDSNSRGEKKNPQDTSLSSRHSHLAVTGGGQRRGRKRRGRRNMLVSRRGLEGKWSEILRGETKGS